LSREEAYFEQVWVKKTAMGKVVKEKKKKNNIEKEKQLLQDIRKGMSSRSRAVLPVLKRRGCLFKIPRQLQMVHHCLSGCQ